MEDADDLCAIILVCNLVGNPKEQFLDSGVTRHIFSTKEAFSTYTSTKINKNLIMGNTTTRIARNGKVMLIMTSDKVLTLNNVLHVPPIRNNFVSDALLVKNEFKCVLVSFLITLPIVVIGYINSSFLSTSPISYPNVKST